MENVIGIAGRGCEREEKTFYLTFSCDLKYFSSNSITKYLKVSSFNSGCSDLLKM